MDDLEARLLAENMRVVQERLAGDAVGLLALGQIVDAYQRSDAKLGQERANALTDSLTGLPNRRAFDEDINWGAAHIVGDHESGRPTIIGRGLAMYDLDHFKTINDTLGHPQGDRILRLSAIALRLAHREGDKIYRLGGDEFAANMPLYTPSNPDVGIPEDDVFAEMLKARFLEEAELLGDGRYKTLLLMNNFGEITADDKSALEILGTSVGVVTEMGNNANMIRMLARADQKMYAMKSARKTR